MSAITADNTVAIESKALDFEGYKVDLPVAASTVIYKNSFVGLNASGYLTSYVAPAVYTGATATGTSFRGIALEHIASQTSNGDKRCRVLIDGYFEYTLTSVAVTDVGGPVFVADNATLSTSAVGACIGHIVGYETTNKCVIRLDPFAAYNGKLLTVVSATLDLCTLGQKILLVHETDNHNGLICAWASAYVSEAILASDAAGVITLQHTADESMATTITAVDNSAVADVLLGTPTLTNGTSGDAMIIAPAGKQINAEVTTANNQGTAETGEVEIYAAFQPVK